MRNILTLFAFIVIGYYFYNFLKREKFVAPRNKPDNIRFMSAIETREFIMTDPDSFSHNLSPWDLIARNASTEAEYRSAAAASAADFTNDQIARFQSAAYNADRFLETASFENLDCKQIAKLPWIFGITNGDKYEDGLPHTRRDVIFVSNGITETPDFLTKTLIHEKIHVYERTYPEIMQDYLSSHGFARWKKSLGVPRIRSNPDLDGWIYFNENTQKPMAAYYSSDAPHSITDVILMDPAYEHPYELLAYKIAEQYQ